MSTKTATGNGNLTALWAIGIVLALIGVGLWLANQGNDTGQTSGEAAGQVVGGSMLGAGVTFIALALVAGAICHQIRQSAR